MSLNEQLAIIRDTCTQKKKPTTSLVSPSAKRQRLLKDTPLAAAALMLSAAALPSTRLVQKEGTGDNEGGSQRSVEADDTLQHFSNNYVRKEHEKLDREMAQLEERRKAILKQHSSFVYTYLHGLERISKLTDLRDAPDAIMPNNFC